MNAPQVPAVVQQLTKYETAFGLQNAVGLNFASECLFARAQLTKNNFTMDTAEKNPMSLKSAILNVAAIGISLNPASAWAYLVPRDGAICLDLSYRGMVKLATDCGAIAWAKAELVYEGDAFEWHGMTQMPTHTFDPFAPERMDAKDPMKGLRGGYCVAQLADGTYLIDRMTAAEIVEVRNSSKGYSSGKSSPWKGAWAGEMAKKTLVKRASKSWPQSTDRARFDRAIEVINEHEGFDDATVIEAEKQERITTEQATIFTARLHACGASVEKFCGALGIAQVSDMPTSARLASERMIARREAHQ